MAVAVVALVITGADGGAAATVRVSDAVPVPPLLIADRAIVDGPAVVGVPLITPVLVEKTRPAGSPVAP